MPVVLPELRIGKPAKCSGWVVYPLFEAQTRLFEDEPHADIACLPVEFRAEVAMIAKGLRRDGDGNYQPCVTNTTDRPLLLMPGTLLATSQALTVPLMVPATTTLVIPSLCRAGSTGEVVRSGRLMKGAQGAILVAGRLCYVHLFGSAALCRRAWYRLLMAQPCRGQPLPRTELTALLCKVHSLPWKSVKSVGYGREWVTLQPGLRGVALSVGRKLVYLRVVSTS